MGVGLLSSDLSAMRQILYYILLLVWCLLGCVSAQVCIACKQVSCRVLGDWRLGGMESEAFRQSIKGCHVLRCVRVGIEEEF